ncbi:MAG: tetratricopeptide repeat protein [Burkholderiales bacterium]
MTHSHFRIRAGAALLAVLLGAIAQPALAQDATLDRARSMLQANQGKAAFDLLSPLEEQRAGNADFDYLLGLAAIEAGELTRAVFALERALAVRPDHPQARAEIARAYFLMGENRAARQEFEAVKASQPPAAVVATVDRFLSALDERTAPFRTGVTGFLEVSAGHDSNANAAAGGTGLAIPALPGFAFNPGLRSDTFHTVAGGINGRYVINPAWSLFGNASLNQRFNGKADRFDTGSYGVDGGVVHRDGANEYTVGLQQQTFEVDNTRFREALGGVAQWRHSLTDRQQVAVYGQITQLRYPTASIRDANRAVLGVAWANSFDMAYAPVVYAGAYAGREHAQNGQFPEMGHRVLGLRGGGQLSFSDTLNAFVNLSYEQRRYGSPQGADARSITSFFPFGRADDELSVRIGANWKFARNWTLTPALAFTDSDSNVNVSDYKRTVGSVTIRYDFR